VPGVKDAVSVIVTLVIADKQPFLSFTRICYVPAAKPLNTLEACHVVPPS
jgi:hypothetical protein